MGDSVFLVHGRDRIARNEVIKLLSSVGIATVSWGLARELTALPNPSVLDIVRAGMDATEATVVLLTGDEITQLLPSLGSEQPRRQARPNVLLELGWALCRDPTSTVLVKIGESDLMSDIEGISVPTLTNVAGDRREFLKRIESAGCTVNWTDEHWLSPDTAGDFSLPFPSSEGLLPAASEGSGSRPTLGDVADVPSLFTPYLVDTTLSLELSQENLFEEVRRRIREGQGLDLKYHYVGPQLSAYWKAVVQDPLYGHDILEQLNETNMPEIISAAALKGNPCSLVSLGPGDGRIDAAFLRELIKEVPDLRYHLIDISVDLLQMAVRSVQDDPVLAAVPIRAYLADFEKSLGTISLFLREEDRRVLFLLTGFTLGNSGEDIIVSAIESAMIEGDCLLVDARLHRYGSLGGKKAMDLPRESIQELMRSYSSTAVSQFAFGPIEVATDFSVDPFDEQRDKVAFGTSPKIGYSAVPEALTVSITCQGIYNPKFGKFNKKVGLNRMQVVARGRKELDLAQVTFYNYGALCGWLSQRFELLWSHDAGSVGLFLVRR